MNKMITSLKNIFSLRPLFFLGIGLKIILLIWVFLQWPYLVKPQEISYENWLGSLSLYFIYGLLLVIWIDIAIHRQRTILQKICISLMTVGVVFNTLHVNFFNVPISSDSIEVTLKPILWGIHGNVDVMKFLRDTFLYSKIPIIIFFAMMGCFFAPPFIRTKTFFSNLILFVFVAVVMAKGLHTPLYSFPPAVSFYSPLVALVTNKQLDYHKKDPVTLTADQKPPVKNILFIIDESVRGDYLSINTPSLKTTPFLEQLKQQGTLITYGASCSTANYTTTSFSLIRFGADPYVLSKKDRVNPYYNKPTIFMYAKKAGFKTAYVDNEVINDTFSDYMTPTEKSYVDYWQQKTPNEPLDTIDHKKLVHIKAFFEKDNAPKFMIYRKMGSHLPYEAQYPHKRSTFTCSSACTHKERIITDYKNSISYKVDDFFKELIPLLDLKNTIIIYSSDHGQSLFEDGTSLGHGMVVNPPIEQVNVPMVVITRQKDLKKQFGKTSSPKTAFQVFPTLLELFGFKRNQIQTVTRVQPLYEDESQKGHIFLSGNIFSTQTPPDYEVNQCYIQKRGE